MHVSLPQLLLCSKSAIQKKTRYLFVASTDRTWVRNLVWKTMPDNTKVYVEVQIVYQPLQCRQPLNPNLIRITVNCRLNTLDTYIWCRIHSKVDGNLEHSDSEETARRCNRVIKGHQMGRRCMFQKDLTFYKMRRIFLCQ